MLRNFALAGWLGLALNAATARAAEPLRTVGEISADIAVGRFQGSVCISNWPAQARGAFVLNAGLNVARITDASGKALDFGGLYDGAADGEGRVYTVATPFPATLCVSYVGAFPVYPAHDAPTDFKGLIAFNGDSVRASEQAVWLPTPFDARARTRIGDTAYDLKVSCAGCQMIYVNGSPPSTGGAGRFVSAAPRPPLLFGGTGPSANGGGLTFVNVAPGPETAAALAGAFKDFRGFYAGYMGRGFEDTPTLLRMIALDQAERDLHGSSWGFASWPTIALAGAGIDGLGAGLRSHAQKDEWVLAYLSHETAHYYFGHLNAPTGRFTWLLTESTAEFLSIKAQTALAGPDAAARHIGKLVAAFDKHGPYPPLDTIAKSEEITPDYRYNYGPLLLLSLERAVGPQKMQAFVRTLFAAPSPQSWDELAALAGRAGIGTDVWRDWRATCVTDAPKACIDGLAH